MQVIEMYSNKTSFYQWDLNQKLKVIEASVDEVHFGYRGCEEALVCEVYELDGVRVADVPNILLQDTKEIVAYCYCEKCYTKFSKVFSVIPKPKPASYVYEETEVKTWGVIEERVAECEAIVGDIEAAIDAIIDLENSYIGGAK